MSRYDSHPNVADRDANPGSGTLQHSPYNPVYLLRIVEWRAWVREIDVRAFSARVAIGPKPQGFADLRAVPSMQGP